MSRIKSLSLLFGCLAASGCLAQGPGNNGGSGGNPGWPSGGGGGGNDTPTPTMPTPTPAPPPPPPAPAPYVRASLRPVYQLASRNEYGRIQQNGVSLSDTDFETQQVNVSAAQKLDEIGALPELLGGPTNLIPDSGDRQRASFIPFRGNPTDVKFFVLNGQTNVYVPLGGDVMTPGNEVAVVQNNNLIARLKVGVRPQRLAVHPAGLIFVCNEYSNFISIIDPNTNQLLRNGANPVEVPTEFYCADMLFVPAGQVQDTDHQFLYVANRWRHSVLKYQANIIRDAISNRPVNVDVGKGPLTEILGVGSNPFRLSLSDQQDAIFVANNKGGELARIEVRGDIASQRITIGAPSADVVNIQDLLFVPTTMPDRGFLFNGESHPQQVIANPLSVTGIDGQQHIAHPGALFDNTKSYNFEDVRNGLYQLDFRLATIPQTNQTAINVYYTDDISAEANFTTQQKVLSGSLATTVIRNAAGTQIMLAEGGSDQVEILNVNTASRPFTVTKGAVIPTGHRPFGLAFNEAAGQLYVSCWGGERLQIFDLKNNNNQLANIDLGYAQPPYPATNIEKGELFFLNTGWSNNGRKACASCHFDELDTDGVGFGNGATNPTAPHQVKPNHNLATTDSYFWNGSFSNGNYTSVAFAAQTRTNCELVELALIEGAASDPNVRVGDPNNRVTNGQDAQCRPVNAGPAALANQAQIDQVKAAELQIRNQLVQQVTGLNNQDLSRVIDAYSVSELRLPPNPLHQLSLAGKLDATVQADVTAGQALYMSAGCASCHNPGNTRAPFTDGLNHGTQADWTTRFIARYSNDARVLAILPGGFPQAFLQASPVSVDDHEVNVNLDPLDFFIPFCFDLTNCLEFDDPLVVIGTGEETRRLNLLVTVNLADPDRQFLPGNVRGALQINTPSLRGVWTQAAFLHNAFGHTIAESILGPGHPALGPGETGWAVDAKGSLDVHGATSKLPPSQVKQLIRFIESIE